MLVGGSVVKRGAPVVRPRTATLGLGGSARMDQKPYYTLTSSLGGDVERGQAGVAVIL